MNLEDLKSAYGNAGGENVSKDRLQWMTRARNHPSLKGMRKQLIIESVFWTVFLMIYYDFFDGHLKPIIWNVVLVFAVLLLLLHSILGYSISMYVINGQTIKESLGKYLQKIRIYAYISIVSRVIAIIAVMLFFASSITFNSTKYWPLAAICLIVLFQVYALQKVWSHRITAISKSFAGFE